MIEYDRIQVALTSNAPGNDCDIFGQTHGQQPGCKRMESGAVKHWEIKRE